MDVGGHLCRGFLTGQSFRLRGFPASAGTKLTILNGKVSSFRLPLIKIDDQARVLVHKPRQLDDVLQVVETCVGLGALGHGAKEAGFQVVCMNDINPKFCQHLRDTGEGFVVEGDIASLDTIAKIHAMASGAATMAFGFNCQPFSRLGDQKHGFDHRAQSLPSALYAAYLLQMECVIAECVPEASTSNFVQKCLDQYMEATQSARSETLLELSDLWPAKRRRWWTVLTKANVGQVRLEPLPKLDATPTIRCVLQRFLDLQPDELRQLTLSPEERTMFNRFGKGMGAQIVETNLPLATSLHAWGNQCQACECGCRPAFSEARLQQAGLYGALVYVAGQTPSTDLRHISPKEMALLNGYAKTTGWEGSQRLLMAGVGQLASPVQSAWIFGALRNHLADNHWTSAPKVPCQEILLKIFDALWDLRDEWFPDHPSVPMQVFQHQLKSLLTVKSESMVPYEAGLLFDAQLDQAIADHLAEHDTTKVPASVRVQTGLQQAEPCTDPHQRVDSVAPVGPSVAVASPSECSRPDHPMPDVATTSPGICPNTGAMTAFASSLPRDAINKEPEANQLPESGMHPTEDDKGTDADMVREVPAPLLEEEPIQSHESGVHTTEVEEGADAEMVHEVPAPVNEADLSQDLQSWIAQALLDHIPVVVDFDTHTWTPMPSTPDVRVADLEEADQKLTGQHFCYTTLMGQQVPHESKLVDHEVLVRHGKPVVFTDVIGKVQAQLQGLTRSHALTAQQGCVAVDELCYYMQGIASSHQVHMIRPLVVHTHDDVNVLVHAWKQELSCPAETIVTAILAGQHWVPFVIHTANAQPSNMVTTMEGKAMWEFFYPTDAETQTFHVIDMPAAQFPFDCGFRALDWIIAVVQARTPEGLSLQSAATGDSFSGNTCLPHNKHTR